MSVIAPQPKAHTRIEEPCRWPGIVERWDGEGTPVRGTRSGSTGAGVVLVCEHASNSLSGPWSDLGLDAGAMQAHIAWDPGALGLARGLAERMAGPCGGTLLVHAPLSRLIYDLNRAPDLPGAMPERSEIHEIPGNARLGAAARAARTSALYAPFHATLMSELATQMALGRRPAVITVHSFTPVYAGMRREVEFGVIHDADATLARAIVDGAGDSTLVTRLNEPYSAADHVTHTLRLHATPYGLPNAMLEIRNDLIADDAAQAAMASRLAPILVGAIEKTEAASCPAS
ncbi:N-formylglutamate amidohydrolase [Chelativorans sp. ZYF759]|uniref:N-formylglutamate amidohydrolase n=1 Tax=Chelativorans sp. ZYF759 TaxID=2692213 RepID=UPI00145F87B4|nr:N-formylglutamate amidohydrolase [Chelativorans sp. ZYF759]NMG41589.1 N-formylglutamate amidohydrolase [Chelativorans sp. ZYF759]